MNFRRAFSSYHRPFLCKRTSHCQLQTCSYHIDSLDNQLMKHNNAVSRRLYRILLKSCHRGVEIANKGNYIDNVGSGNYMLLQPSMDPRKYGFAKIVKARRGQTFRQGNNLPKVNTAASIMNRNDVGMAMEVLRFVHMSLGGDADDDLDHYYLGVDGESSDIIGASAGRHSEGHYTQFLDKDEERGEGPTDLTGTYGDALEKKIDTDDEEEAADASEGLEIDESILVTTDDLKNAVKIGFRAPLISSTPSNEETWPMQTIIQRRHRDAIDASYLLTEQLRMWSNKSSISVNIIRGVRVVATSCCLMRSSAAVGASGEDKKSYRFAYRIRVENIADLMETKNQSFSDESGNSALEQRAVQLLGRTWRISECHHRPRKQRLLDDGALLNEGSQDEQEERREVQVVNEPRTGAVGHLPVLGPGDVFEYMSGAEITTPKGKMEGCFHMALVDMETSDSAHVGDPVEALSWASNDKRRFEAPVGRFGFLVDDFNRGSSP